jgi:hypothetical protein
VTDEDAARRVFAAALMFEGCFEALPVAEFRALVDGVLRRLDWAGWELRQKGDPLLDDLRRMGVPIDELLAGDPAYCSTPPANA